MFKIRFWKRKFTIFGSDEGFFEFHSGAMERKKAEVRFGKCGFAAQSMKFKHALN